LTNKNYVSGAYYERKTVNLLRDQGYHAQRTAGSHGLFDVIAVGHGQVRLINIKKGYWPPPKERAEFYGLDAPPVYCWIVPDGMPDSVGWYSPLGTSPADPMVKRTTGTTLEIWRWDKGAKEPEIRYETDWK